MNAATDRYSSAVDSENLNQCPNSDGKFGTDWRIFDIRLCGFYSNGVTLCQSCNRADLCRKEHDRMARGLRDNKIRAYPLQLQIPIGLMVSELDAIDRGILALVYFRYRGRNEGISFDKNVRIAG